MSKGKALVTVKVRNGDINKALKTFKRSVIQSGHILELKERQQFTKPTVKRRKQKMEAIRKAKFERMKEDTYEAPIKGKKNKR
jgi:small subunit ribosomal protein S21